MLLVELLVAGDGSLISRSPKATENTMK